MKLYVKSCKKILFWYWLSATLLICFIVFIYSCYGKFGDKNDYVWKWYASYLMPNLSLMLSVLVSDYKLSIFSKRKVESNLFIATILLSTIYFLVFIFTLISSYFHIKQLDAMNLSTNILFWLQGLITAFIGLFFINEATKEKDSITEIEK